MDMMRLIALGSKLKDLNVSADISAFKEVFEFLGVDEATGTGLLSMIQLQAKGPDQLFTDFLKSGGLVKVLTSPGERVEESTDILQCPHCAELIFG